ncbi:MAG: hypothetical protein GY849_17715 [Deltaproteobacteria bacterium]|nr:hypothetical protein [Deltaproteobacteria bacterium]
MIKRDTLLGCVVITLMSVLVATSAFHGCEADAAAKRRDVVLLLAQSCVGEAGFRAHLSGECAAIWSVYRKRAARSGASLYRQTQQYSAAVKPIVGRSHLWVLHLNRAGTKPQHWQRGLPWDNHRRHWLATLRLARLWLSGAVPDPTPTALHYGGRIDRNRLDMKVWKRITTPGFGNWFYERRQHGGF